MEKDGIIFEQQRVIEEVRGLLKQLAEYQEVEKQRILKEELIAQGNLAFFDDQLKQLYLILFTGKPPTDKEFEYLRARSTNYFRMAQLHPDMSENDSWIIQEAAIKRCEQFYDELKGGLEIVLEENGLSAEKAD